MSAALKNPRRALAIAAVLLAMALVVLDAAIANVALPTIAVSLQVTPAMSVWIVTAYQAALVMALLPCASIGESFGYRRTFVLGIAVFTVASVACALSPSLPWLLAARIVQGLGGASIMALGVALLRFAVPHHQLGAAIGWNAVTVAASSAAGPAIGAAILSISSWPALFAVNLPLGGAALFACQALPRVKGIGRRPDVVSIGLNVATFASLVVGAELLAAIPLPAVVLFVVATFCLIILVQREAPKSAPMIPFDLLRAPAFRISVIASVCCFAGQAAGLLALSFYLQHDLGQTTLMTGFYMTFWPVAVAITAPFAGHLADRLSTAWLCVIGGLVLSIGLAAACLCPLQGDPWPLVPITLLCGVGFGLFNVSNNRNMFLSAPRDRSSAAGGMQGTARLVGQSTGAVIVTLLFVLTPMGAAPRVALGIGAVLTLAAGSVSALRAGKVECSTR